MHVSTEPMLLTEHFQSESIRQLRTPFLWKSGVPTPNPHRGASRTPNKSKFYFPLTLRIREVSKASPTLIFPSPPKQPLSLSFPAYTLLPPFSSLTGRLLWVSLPPSEAEKFQIYLYPERGRCPRPVRSPKLRPLSADPGLTREGSGETQPGSQGDLYVRFSTKITANRRQGWAHHRSLRKRVLQKKAR